MWMMRVQGSIYEKIMKSLKRSHIEVGRHIRIGVMLRGQISMINRKVRVGGIGNHMEGSKYL